MTNSPIQYEVRLFDETQKSNRITAQECTLLGDNIVFSNKMPNGAHCVAMYKNTQVRWVKQLPSTEEK